MICDNCHKREGRITQQFAHGPCGLHGEVPRFVFRSWHCPWCLAAENRKNKKAGRPITRYQAWKPDEVVMDS